MADEIDLDAIFPIETEDAVYARLLADLPDAPGGIPYNAREGSLIHALFRPLAVERVRLIEYAQEAFRQAFISYATGSALDAHATDLGFTRRGASAAQTTLTVTAPAGTSIPAGSRASTEGNPVSGDPGLVFITSVDAQVAVAQTTVNVSVVAAQPGAAGNVGPDTITLIDFMPTEVTAVTNPASASGGADVQDDESLRQELLTMLQALPGTGNAASYRLRALQNPGVGVAAVADLWDGAGTAALVLAGTDFPYVTSDVIEGLQTKLDPSVQCLAHFEADETWTVGGTGGTQVIDVAFPLEGAASRKLTVTSSNTAYIERVGLAYNLAAWNATTDEVWLWLRRDTAANTYTSLLIRFQSATGSDTATATIAAATINALSNIATTGALLKTARSAFTTAGAFSWGNITQIRLSIVASGTGPGTLTFDGMRIARDLGGFIEGDVPVGIQMTVRSGRALGVTVAATLTLKGGVALSDVTPLIQTDINTFFRSLPPGSTVRITEVGNILHDTIGVIDYSSLLLNGAASNLVCLADQGPVLTTLTLT